MSEYLATRVLFTEPLSESARRIQELETALHRIANTKHGARDWMQSAARKALSPADPSTVAPSDSISADTDHPLYSLIVS